MAGVTIMFSVSGVNPTIGSDVTNGSGDAVFTYPGGNTGADTITAFADTDESGTREAGEPQDTAAKAWLEAPVPKCPGFESDPAIRSSERRPARRSLGRRASTSSAGWKEPTR